MNDLGVILFTVVMLRVTLTELLNTTGCVYQFLFSSEKRMTGRTNLNLQFRQHTADLHLVTAGAGRFYNVVFRMYIILHFYPTALQKASSLGS